MTTGVPADDPFVRRLMDGDEAAFGSLVASWSPLMLRLARRHVTTAQSAEDVVQETWLSMLRALPRFEGRCSLRTWVLRILVNKARSCGAREHRTTPWAAAFTGAGGPPPEAGGQWPDGWRTVPPRRPVTPEGALLAAEVRALVAETVARLPARQRAVIELRDVLGYTADEACRILGVSCGNQRVLLHRARMTVRAGVEDYLAPCDAAPCRRASADASAHALAVREAPPSADAVSPWRSTPVSGDGRVSVSGPDASRDGRRPR